MLIYTHFLSREIFMSLSRFQSFKQPLANFTNRMLANRYHLCHFTTSCSYDNGAHITPAENHLLQRMKEGNILVKIISNKESTILYRSSWQQNISQLLDYEFRAPLRKQSRPDSLFYRYSHLQDRISWEWSGYNLDSKKIIEHTHTIKTSTTLISHRLHTTTYNLESLIPVGNLYDAEYCVIKAMFNRSAFTSYRGWVSTNRFQVLLYKFIYVDLLRIAYLDFNEFKNHVDKESNTKTNEVLAQLSRESLSGILVDLTKINASDREDNVGKQHNEALSEACQLARVRQCELRTLFNKNLPIIFYNSKKQTVRVYTAQQQDEDEHKISLKC